MLRRQRDRKQLAGELHTAPKPTSAAAPSSVVSTASTAASATSPPRSSVIVGDRVKHAGTPDHDSPPSYAASTNAAAAAAAAASGSARSVGATAGFDGFRPAPRLAAPSAQALLPTTAAATAALLAPMSQMQKVQRRLAGVSGPPLPQQVRIPQLRQPTGNSVAEWAHWAAAAGGGGAGREEISSPAASVQPVPTATRVRLDVSAPVDDVAPPAKLGGLGLPCMLATARSMQSHLPAKRTVPEPAAVGSGEPETDASSSKRQRLTAI